MSAYGNISVNSFHDYYFHLCDNYSIGMLIWAIFNVIIPCFGLPVCVLVLWELFQKHRRGTPTTPNDVFMLNLTVMDSAYLFYLPIGVFNFIKWRNWAVHCGYSFVCAFYWSGRPLFMTCICLDCYLAVVHPILYRARKGLTSRVLLSVCVWAVTLIYGGFYSQFSFEMLQSFISILPFVIVILITGYCDFFILRALKSSDPARRDLHPQKKKALQIIINSLVMTVIAYLPQLLSYVMDKSVLMTVGIRFCVVSVPFQIISSSSGVIMPILYLGNLGKLDRVWIWCHKTT